jgi:hypothetical protein
MAPMIFTSTKALHAEGGISQKKNVCMQRHQPRKTEGKGTLFSRERFFFLLISHIAIP